MERHLLLSTFIESLIYFNSTLYEMNPKVFKSLSAYSHSFCGFFSVDVDLLEEKLDLLESNFKDKNLRVKSKKSLT